MHCRTSVQGPRSQHGRRHSSGALFRASVQPGARRDGAHSSTAGLVNKAHKGGQPPLVSAASVRASPEAAVHRARPASFPGFVSAGRSGA